MDKKGIAKLKQEILAKEEELNHREELAGLRKREAELNKKLRAEKQPQVVKDFTHGMKIMGKQIGKGMDNYAKNMNHQKKHGKKMNVLPDKIDILGNNKKKNNRSPFF